MNTINTYSKADKWLFYSICAYFIMNGAQVWETALMVPAWTAAPPASLIFFRQPYGLDFKAFWIITHGIHELIFIAALMFNWKIKQRRNAMLLILAGHIAVRVWTLLYFAPTIIEFQQLPPADSIDAFLVQKAAMWRHLNYLRVGIFFLLNVSLIPVFKLKNRNND